MMFRGRDYAVVSDIIHSEMQGQRKWHLHFLPIHWAEITERHVSCWFVQSSVLKETCLKRFSPEPKPIHIHSTLERGLIPPTCPCDDGPEPPAHGDKHTHWETCRGMLHFCCLHKIWKHPPPTPLDTDTVCAKAALEPLRFSGLVRMLPTIVLWMGWSGSSEGTETHLKQSWEKKQTKKKQNELSMLYIINWLIKPD